ncbi:MAG: alginate export family protein [Verrucomicrobiae bacterium]|nr:alginate export family protein [Verrucomicrobiae bacterium]NNJ41764.1 alginate export family protein [Akkermansiaceae bacterium]
MNTPHKTALALAMITASTLSGVAGPATTPSCSAPDASRSILDSIHLFGTARLRYEFADIDGYDDANVGSLRARFGIKTDSISGFKFLAEGETTVILTDKDKYTPFPGFTNNGRAVIADPDNLELNRLQLSYEIDAIDTTITVGRQYINFADQRFIGAVGWRQNDQTFDAVVVENNTIDHLKFTYAYVDQVNRIFGDQTPAQGLDYWSGESHLIHTEYTGIDDHTVRAFAYLLEFDNSSANSTDTYGLELQGEKGSLNYLLTAAVQNDAGNNMADYQEYYYRGQIGVKQDVCHYGAGFEVMTSDGSNSFRMPLGTNHKFNGFADAYLTTPAAGLVDYFAWVGTKALGFNHTLTVHNFSTESGGTELGWEVDYVATRKICDNATLLLKAAHLEGDGSQVDITRASAEISLSF